MNDNHPPEDLNIIKKPNTETCFFRYNLASSYCHDKEVLDVACGAGYGSHILKMFAKSVMGMDKDEKAIAYAKKQYPSIDFIVNDIIDSNMVNQFDVVVSIETFEHIHRHLIGNYLGNLLKWCKEGGTIFITTPQRATYSFKYDDKTSHLYEYSPSEFMDVIVSNIKGDYEFFGIQEVPIGYRQQLVSILHPFINESHIMIAVIKNVRHGA